MNSSLCQECQLGFWLFSNSCYTSCPISTYYNLNKTCQSCSQYCYQCIDTDTCQICYAPYLLNNGTCQYYSTNCNISSYYFDARVRNCISCPNGC